MKRYKFTGRKTMTNALDMEEMPQEQFLLELDLLTKLCIAEETPLPMKQHSVSKTLEPAPPPMRYKKISAR